MESCTVLVEHQDGEMQLLDWPAEVLKRREREALPAAA